MDELLYDNMVEAAAERAADTGAVDLVDIANAAESGFDTDTFVTDATELAHQIVAAR